MKSAYNVTLYKTQNSPACLLRNKNTKLMYPILFICDNTLFPSTLSVHCLRSGFVTFSSVTTYVVFTVYFWQILFSICRKEILLNSQSLMSGLNENSLPLDHKLALNEVFFNKPEEAFCTKRLL